jgi:fermentation-respiration switch protein FrsA (DUF1100 family)
MIFEDHFIYFPSKYPQGIYEDSHIVPGRIDCWFTTEDGVRLHAWYAAAESALATIVLSHGNAGNISHRIYLMRHLLRSGLNVLMYDYRGYGRSEGTPSEEGIYRDGRAAFDYAASLSTVDSSKIILWGTSLGGAVAVEVATQRPAAGVILESTFTSARDVARVAYPFLPVKFVIRAKFDSIGKIGKVRAPLLVMHGDQDSIIPIELGRKLYEAAPEPKEFYTIVGADHNDTYLVGADAYFEKVRQFIQSALTQRFSLPHIPHPRSSGR